MGILEQIEKEKKIRVLSGDTIEEDSTIDLPKPRKITFYVSKYWYDLLKNEGIINESSI